MAHDHRHKRHKPAVADDILRVFKHKIINYERQIFLAEEKAVMYYKQHIIRNKTFVY